jgi:hypothetical protein
VEAGVTVHYHGTPITPHHVIYQLAGRNFCVSFADPRQVEVCHEIGQSVMLDNGAFSAWRSGKGTDWTGYYAWCERWLEYRTTWAVIPDVIEGTEEENDELIRQWPHGPRAGAPVWHVHESIPRLLRLCDRFDRVCIGSSGEYATVGDEKWRIRMDDVFTQLCNGGPSPTWLHMLRGMRMAKSGYPFASVDSTDIARHHNETGRLAGVMAQCWDGHNCPPRVRAKRPVKTGSLFDTPEN